MPTTETKISAEFGYAYGEEKFYVKLALTEHEEWYPASELDPENESIYQTVDSVEIIPMNPFTQDLERKVLNPPDGYYEINVDFPDEVTALYEELVFKAMQMHNEKQQAHVKEFCEWAHQFATPPYDGVVYHDPVSRYIDLASIAKAYYKYSSAGIWVLFDVRNEGWHADRNGVNVNQIRAVQIGASVEGSDAEITADPIKITEFTRQLFSEAINYVETEAEAAFQEAKSYKENDHE